MFWFFRKKKAIGQLATSIVTMINASLLPVRADPFAVNAPEEMSTDKFALGYINGLACTGAHSFGFSKPKEMGLVIIAVYDLLFPGRGVEIANKCTEWLNKKDNVVLDAARIAVGESSVVYKAMHKFMASGDENVVKESSGALKTFNKHIRKNYL